MMWLQVDEGHLGAYELFKRHYSYEPPTATRNKSRQILGPGEKMLLVTNKVDALFGWRKFIDDCVVITDEGDSFKQYGVNCAVFRNESQTLSSTMILEAERIAWMRWPGERLYTHVNPHKLGVRKSRGREYCPLPPGRCFIEAGWRVSGRTKTHGHLVFEKFPPVVVRAAA